MPRLRFSDAFSDALYLAAVAIAIPATRLILPLHLQHACMAIVFVTDDELFVSPKQGEIGVEVSLAAHDDASTLSEWSYTSAWTKVSDRRR
jgi:hypothetical protein